MVADPTQERLRRYRQAIQEGDWNLAATLKPPPGPAPTYTRPDETPMAGPGSAVSLRPAGYQGMTPAPMRVPLTTRSSATQLSDLTQDVDAAQTPLPAGITSTQPTPPGQGPVTGYDIQLQQATQQRKQATNARYAAAGQPVPYPEAVQAIPGQPQAAGAPGMPGMPGAQPSGFGSKVDIAVHLIAARAQSNLWLANAKAFPVQQAAQQALSGFDFDSEEYSGLPPETRSLLKNFASNGAKNAYVAPEMHEQIVKVLEANLANMQRGQAQKATIEAADARLQSQQDFTAQQQKKKDETQAEERVYDRQVAGLAAIVKDSKDDIDDLERKYKKAKDDVADETTLGKIDKEIKAARDHHQTARKAWLTAVLAGSGTPPTAPGTPTTQPTATSVQAPAQPAATPSVVREPSDSEKTFFASRPDVAGMATEDGRVIINPGFKGTEQEKQAVILNETTRLALRKNPAPPFALTPEQQAKFKDYSKNPQDVRDTIIARIVSGDPSAGNVTDEQRKIAQKYAPATGTQAPAKPTSQAEYDALPRGTRYVHRDGTVREKK